MKLFVGFSSLAVQSFLPEKKTIQEIIDTFKVLYHLGHLFEKPINEK